MKSYRRNYPAELKDALRRSKAFLLEAGISTSTIRRLKRGEVKRPRTSTLDKIVMHNTDFWYEKLKAGGITDGYAEELIKVGNPAQWRFEIERRKEIARVISRNRDDGKDHPLNDVLEGMSKSEKVMVEDWVRYTKELYNEEPEIEFDRRAIIGVRPMSRRRRRKYLTQRRKKYG
jgi:hypothetical protein